MRLQVAVLQQEKKGIKKKKKKEWLMCHALACHKLIVLYKNDMMSSDPVESEPRTSLL